MALVAEYAFSEGTGTTAADSSGGGHTLTIASGAATWATGHSGGGLAGNTTGVGGVNTTLSNPTSNLTIMAWVKPHTVSGAEEPLLGYWSSPSGDPNGSSQFALYATRSAFGTANKLVGDLRIGGSLGEIVGPALTADTWVHVALAFDGTTISLFVNGTLFTSVTRAGTLGVGAFGVVGRSDATADDVRVFSTALNAAQVTTQMNSPAGAPPHGSGAGTFAYVGTASGHENTHGSASGARTHSGTAAGHTAMAGAASGAYAFTGAAGGHTQPHGASTGQLAYAGAASGHENQHGNALGAFAYAGSASGHTPTIGMPHGSAAGVVAYVGAADGHLDAFGSAAGTFAYSGSARGTSAQARDITISVDLLNHWSVVQSTSRWEITPALDHWKVQCHT